MAAQKNSVWRSSGVDLAGYEDASSLEWYEHNVGNLAIEVVGQNCSSEALSLFLENWEVGRVALSCHLSMDLVCQEMRDAWWPLVHCVPEGRRCGSGSKEAK